MKTLQRTLAGGFACAFLALTLASCGTEDPAVVRLKEAQKAYDAALQSQRTAEQALTDANRTLTSHEQEAASIQRSQPALEDAITQAIQNRDTGELTYQQKQNDTSAAQQAFAQLEKEQEEPRRYQNSSLGFFIWNAPDSGSDIDTITKLFLGQLPVYNEVKPDLSDPNDAVSYKNFKASIQWIDKCNEMRHRENKSEGLDLKDLPVNDLAMAAAQLHADYSAYAHGHHANSSSCKFPFGENLAWGSYRKYSDGAFNAWYTVEKEQYKITPEWNNKTGHYLNIVAPDYTVTGYAINTDPSGYYGQTSAQEFGYSWYGTNRGLKTYTTTEYRARIAAYEAYLHELDTLRDTAQQKVSDAQASEKNALAELKRLENAITSAQKKRDTAAQRLAALTGTLLPADQDAVAAAQETLEQTGEKVRLAKQELDEAQKALDEKSASV